MSAVKIVSSRETRVTSFVGKLVFTKKKSLLEI